MRIGRARVGSMEESADGQRRNARPRRAFYGEGKGERKK